MTENRADGFVDMAPSELEAGYSRRICLTQRRGLSPGLIVEGFKRLLFYFELILLFTRNQRWQARISTKITILANFGPLLGFGVSEQ